MWVEFFVGNLVLAPRGFSLGPQVFPSPQKPTFSNFISIWKVSPISAPCLITLILNLSKVIYLFYFKIVKDT